MTLRALSIGRLVLRPLMVSALVATGSVAAGEPPVPETVAPGAKLVEVYAADAFFEGPVWDRKGEKLYFTAFFGGEAPNQQILRLDGDGKAAVWLDKTEGVNGTWLSNEGRILGAQAYGHRVMSYEIGPDGPKDAKVLAQNGGWNQPNDICQTPSGNVYFTDPDFQNQKTSAVYLLKPDGSVHKVASDMPVPNGVITSLDGKVLYVSDSHEKHWRSYPIAEDGTVGEGGMFFDPETDRRDSPDGMSIDEQGNLYLSGRGGVWVASPEGKSLGLIAVPEFCSNVTFGGPKGRTLYLTCSKKVYALDMAVRGGPWK
ncbi:MAG: SMP-30/gluconolactonase/LRE family protein [Planctomycetes bacterium]|nr:SMP-30/gluconolactonase/LRE family protein [Planctomycetota bacterium]